ncbi:40S ribosomal protein S24 [Manis javanica]|nr:40S ribosomal protein S24 [Manis javanica]
MYKTTPDVIFAFEFRTYFGGCWTTGFGRIYGSLDYANKREPKHRLTDMDCMRRKDLKKTAKGTQEQGEDRQGDCKAQVGAGERTGDWTTGVKILQ